jgi:hypothetical protein
MAVSAPPGKPACTKPRVPYALRRAPLRIDFALPPIK